MLLALAGGWGWGVWLLGPEGVPAGDFGSGGLLQLEDWLLWLEGVPDSAGFGLRGLLQLAVWLLGLEGVPAGAWGWGCFGSVVCLLRLRG